jgi:mannose-6-phosphate isomerase class I
LNKNKLEINSRNAEIILVIDGGAKLHTNKEIICLDKGNAAFIVAGTNYFLSGEGMVFRATVPYHK